MLGQCDQLVPCSPNSAIQVSQLARSPLPTDGLTFFRASWKSSIVRGTVTSFSNSFLHQRLSNLFLSPPSFSPSLTLLSFLRIGIQAAYLHSKQMSAPEYPSVLRTISQMSTPSVCRVRKLILSISRLPIQVGNGMQIRFYSRLLIASSKSQGRLVAPMRTIDLPSQPELTPSMRVISSVLTLRLDSSYFSPLLEAKESIQSMKMVAGAQKQAISKSRRTSFSDSPFHFEAKLEEVTLKKVVFPLEAIALASKVLPVPGGPNNSTPFQALLIPVNRWGSLRGRSTAYSSTSLAFSSSAMSSKLILGLKQTTYFSSISMRLESGPLPSGQQCFRNDFFSSPSPSALVSFPAFFAFYFQGFVYSRLAPPLTTPLLLLLAEGGGPLFLEAAFLSAGFFLGHISASLSSYSRSRSLSAYFYASFSLFLSYFYFQLQSQSSSWTTHGFLNLLGGTGSWSLVASWQEGFFFILPNYFTDSSSGMCCFSRLGCTESKLPQSSCFRLEARSRWAFRSFRSLFHTSMTLLSVKAAIWACVLSMMSLKPAMDSLYFPQQARFLARVSCVLKSSNSFDIQLYASLIIIYQIQFSHLCSED